MSGAPVSGFLKRGARQYGFLLRDWVQPHSGTGDTPLGSDRPLLRLDDTHYALRWAADAPPHQIVYPVQGTLRIMQNGSAESKEDYQLDAARGVVTLRKPVSAATEMTAGFYAFVPVRFDSDIVEMTRLSADLAELTALPLVEISRLREPS